MEKPSVQEPKPPLVEDPRITRQVKIRLAIISGFLLLALVILYFSLSGANKSQSPASPSVSPPAALAAKPVLKLFASGLPNPTAVVSTNQAGDRRLFIVSRDGLIKIVNGGQVVSEPFLDISSRLKSDGEMGLLGLAFSPSYKSDGYFFVNYVDRTQTSVIARYHISTDANKADASSAKTVLTLAQPYQNHNGGALVFGSDGYLYATFGDGGSAGDPGNRAQNLNSLFGKVLRLDVKQLPYKIPASNPFAGQAGKAGEIWDYGLRNPWRISFDRQTRELYIADVGQDKIEEVDVERFGSGGNNYGWRCFEGDQDYNLLGCLARDKYIFPVLQYPHSNGRCSVTGGYVYRGSRYPALAGKYFYGDFCSGELFYAENKGDKWQSTTAAQTSYKFSAFGQDSQGEIYAADFATGNIYHLQNAAP